MHNARIVFPLLVAVFLLTRASYAGESGVLLLAHGGSAQWNARVTELAAQVDKTRPTEVAFGMATRANIQGAVDRLTARGVKDIVAVPLFVSSWSSVITSTEYLLGQRADRPGRALGVREDEPLDAGCGPGCRCGHDGARGTCRRRWHVPGEVSSADSHDAGAQRSSGRGRDSREPRPFHQ